MPIFEKGDKRLYFAHIPKTAGTTVYYAFARAGWRIGKIRQSDNPNSTYQLMKAEFGSELFIDDLDQDNYKFPVQHVPYKEWKKFGALDESFAILRDPLDKFMSELKYRYKIKGVREEQNFEAFAQDTLNKIKRRPWILYRGFAGHLLPQHYFIASDTKLFLIESDWLIDLANHFELEIELDDLRKNISDKKWQVELNSTEKLLLRFFYFKDYNIIKHVKETSRV